jgi:iron complex outermembrane receptor protein
MTPSTLRGRGIRPALLCLLQLTGGGVAAQNSYFDMPLVELLNLQTTSVSRKSQSVSESAAAVFVITEEDLRRSGVTHVADALRMVPGVQVAQIDASKWAVTARGFNNRFANKLLVMVDGRSVYSPLFSGVYWDVQDLVLEDVERIEVIRGPGATLWGANAVNGVINIVTKFARDTHGGLVSAAAGNQERGTVSVRQGGVLGSTGDYRLYAKFFHRDGNHSEQLDGDSADGWQSGRLGFRLEHSPDWANTLSVQGEYYDGRAGETSRVFAVTPPYEWLQDREQQMSGGHLLTRWSHDLSDVRGLSLQLYYDRSDRRTGLFSQTHDTLDLDLQLWDRHRAGHDLLFGLGYRFTADDYDAPGTDLVIPAMRLLPEDRRDQLFSAFVQDDIELLDEQLILTVGCKFEHNDYTGFEYQPNLRLLWRPDERQSVWVSATRAVSTPSRWQHDGVLDTYVEGPDSGLNPLPLPVLFRLDGNRQVDSEILQAFEAGYRMQVSETFSFDAAIYYNRYDGLLSADFGGFHCDTGDALPGCLLATPATQYVLWDNIADNASRGHSKGLELAADWRPHYQWRLQTAYSLLQMAISTPDDHWAMAPQISNPEQQLSLRLAYNPRHNLDVDLWLRYVDPIQVYADLNEVGIPAYTELDLRLAWRPSDDVELSLVGRNLLHGSHPEFRSDTNDLPLIDIERSIHGKVTWRF